MLFRFSKTEYIQITPLTALDPNTIQIDFQLDVKEAPYCYILGDMLQKIQVCFIKIL